jgi:riboflavin synthase
MFTGIIETTGIVKEIIPNGSNLTFWIESPISGELKVDQSVSHDGVCLTVEEIKGKAYRVTAIPETLNKTTLGNWRTGSQVNIERSLALSQRLDGHFVQGHADCTGTCTRKEEADGSWFFRFSFPEKFAALVIEKGSVAVNGISLTCFDVTLNEFSVAIIPYTFSHTNLSKLNKGEKVNLEFDMIGKYIARKIDLSQNDFK